jgi:hypothetical protein
MSEINANIVVQQIGANIVVEENNINITPEDIQLRIFSGGYATPSGNSFEVQFNNGGILGGNPNLKFYPSNTTTVANNLTVSSNLTAANSSLGEALANNLYANSGIIGASLLRGTLVDTAQPNVTSVGNLISLTVVGNISGGNANLGNAVVANYFIGNGSLLTGIDASKIANGNSNVQVYANSNIGITVAGNANVGLFTGTGVNIAGYANVTGNLNSSTLTTGNITATNISASGNIIAANLTSNGNVTTVGLTANGNVSFTGANVSVGNSSNLKITGGINGYFLQTDGTGNLTWAAGGNVTGNGTPGGANTQIQYNNAGNFGGTTGFTFNSSSNLFSAPGNANFIGNVTASYFIGNGSQLTGIDTTQIVNGNSNVRVFANSNVTISSNGIANVFTINNSNTLIAGTTILQQAIEKVTTDGTGSTGTINYDLLSQAILFKTANATANFTLNFRGNSTTSLDTVLSSNQSITCTFINTNGATAYILSNVAIDGANRTVLWINGSAPFLGSVNGKDVYTLNIIKTAANTYTVLGSQGNYY